MESKICTACKQELSLEKFSPAKRGYLNTYSQCRKCSNAKTKIWYEKTKGSKRRNTYYIKQYGLSLEHIETVLTIQEYCCELCKSRLDLDNTRSGLGLAVDHCHTSGIVRGLICNNCNRALGMIKENIQTLENMIKYLKRFE